MTYNTHIDKSTAKGNRKLVMGMATKSILKNVNIKTADDAKRFVEAMEHTENKKAKDVVISRTCSEASKEDIKRMFGV